MPISRRRWLHWAAATGLTGGPVASTPLLAAERRLLIVYNDDYAPYSFVNDQQELVGILPEALRQLLPAQPNLRLEQEGFPWRRVQALVREGGADGMCTFASEERLGFCYSHRIPMVVLRPHLFFAPKAANRAQIEAVRTREDLKRLRVIDLKGNNWAEEHLRDIPDIEFVSDHNTVFRMIRAGRADVHVSLSPVVTQWRIRRLGIPPDEILTMPAPFVAKEVPFHLLIRKTVPEARDLLAMLDHQLSQRNAGELIERLTQKYLG